MRTVTEFVKASGVSFDWHATGYQTDADGWEHHAYVITLTVSDRTESFPWRQGMAVDDEPSITNVLPALISDAQAGELDLVEFLDEFGYAQGSGRDVVRAIETHRACQAIAEQVRALFGEIPDDVTEDD